MKNILKLSAGHLLLSALLVCSLSSAAFAESVVTETKMPEVATNNEAGKPAKVKKDKAGKKNRRMRKKGKKGIKKERSKRLERRGDADGMMRPGKEARPFMAAGKEGKDRMPRLRNHREGGRRSMFFGKRDKSAVKREKVPSRVNRASSKAKAENMEHRGDKKAEKEVVEKGPGKAGKADGKKAKGPKAGKAGKPGKGKKAGNKKAKKAKAEKAKADAPVAAVMQVPAV